MEGEGAGKGLEEEEGKGLEEEEGKGLEEEEVSDWALRRLHTEKRVSLGQHV
jgi:hypothetical protein